MKRFRLVYAALFALAFFAGIFVSCSNSSGGFVPLVPAQKKTSDWLFLFYFDADDSYINDDLYKNIRDIECAFAQSKNADGSAKEGYASVAALVLWDGISQEKKGQQKFIHPDGALYEIGPDYSLQYEPSEGNEYGSGYVKLGDTFCIGPNTKDLTASAGGWLEKEPNMSDPKTLTNFLKWANERYSAQNVVVCLQDHGSGTYKETYLDSTADSPLVSAALCSDATTGSNRLLTCKNVTDAIKAAGWTGASKPKILWNDLCLQATAEIVYNYAGIADYYCSSPNVSCMPDYYKVFANLKSGMTALDVGKTIVSAYFERYYDNPLPAPANEENAKISRASASSMYTSSFISLDEQKTAALKGAVDNLAQALLDIKAKDETLFNSVFAYYVKQSQDNIENCKGLAYCGSYSWLNDLGWLCFDICADNALSDAHASASALKELLKNGDDKLIVYAWGGKRATEENVPISAGWKSQTVKQTYLTGKTDFISKKPVETDEADSWYGLTIVGSDFPLTEAQTSVSARYDEWTGFSSKWGQVLNAWRAL